MRWGVDSAAPVTQALWSALVTQAGRTPAFWGRYLGAGHGAASPVTADEVAFLHSQGAAVLLCYNDGTSTGVPQGWPVGVADGTAAVAAAQKLGAPKGTALVADIEAGWRPHVDWYAGYAQTVMAGGYRPGYYGAIGQEAFTDPMGQGAAWEQAEIAEGIVWAASWRTDTALPTSWAPGGPAALQGRIGLWQYHGQAWGSFDLDVCTDATLATGGLWLPPAQATPDPIDWKARALADEAEIAALRKVLAAGPA